jgi:hypothetical protein
MWLCVLSWGAWLSIYAGRKAVLLPILGVRHPGNRRCMLPCHRQRKIRGDGGSRGRPPLGPAVPPRGPNGHRLCEVDSGWAWNTAVWCFASLVFWCLAPSLFFAWINVGKRLLMVYSMYLCLWPAKWYTPNTCGTRLIVKAYVTKVC